jgi:hypothetical protein
MRSARPTPSTTAAAITQAKATMMAGNVAAHRALQPDTHGASIGARNDASSSVFSRLQAIETAWRSAGADIRITIDSILIVENNRALGLAPWDRCRGAHGALFNKETFKRTFAHDRKDHQEGRHSSLNSPSSVKMRPWLESLKSKIDCK